MGDGRADPDAPSGRGLVCDGLLGFVEVGQDAAGGTEICVAFGCQRERTGGPQQQAGAKPRLDPVEGSTDRRRGQRQPAARSRKAAAIGHGAEDFEFAGAIHVADCYLCS